MSDKPDNAQRTEEPTPKRLQEARKKGDAPKSQEVIAAAMLAAGALGLWLFAGTAAKGLMQAGAVFLDHPHDFLIDGAALQGLFAGIALKAAAALTGLGVLIFAAAILANTGQALPVFTTERMKPSLEKISPIAGPLNVFSVHQACLILPKASASSPLSQSFSVLRCGLTGSCWRHRFMQTAQAF